MNEKDKKIGESAAKHAWNYCREMAHAMGAPFGGFGWIGVGDAHLAIHTAAWVEEKRTIEGAS